MLPTQTSDSGGLGAAASSGGVPLGKAGLEGAAGLGRVLPSSCCRYWGAGARHTGLGIPGGTETLQADEVSAT